MVVVLENIEEYGPNRGTDNYKKDCFKIKNI